MNAPILQPPDDLISSLQEHDCILFAGAGLSAIAGSPTMRTVLERLLDFAAKRGLIDESLGKLLQTGLAEGQDASVAEALVSRTWRDDAPPAEVMDVLKDMFSTLERTRLPRVYGTLRHIPFGAVVTTNIDDFLRRTFQKRLTNGAYTHRDSEQLKAALAKRTFFLLQLRGMLSDPATLLLSDSQYAERLSSNLSFAEFLQTLCMSRTHLFIGTSLEGIESYLSGTSARLANSRPHFALLQVSGESWRLRADALQHRYNLRVVSYGE